MLQNYVRFPVRIFVSVLRSLFGKKLPGKKNNEGFRMKRLISASSLEKLVSSQELVPLAGMSSLPLFSPSRGGHLTFNRCQHINKTFHITLEVARCD